MSIVLDSSAVLAVVLNEPGSEIVLATLGAGVISTVNLSEIYATAGEKGLDVVAVRSAVKALSIRTVPFGETHAFTAGELRRQTRSLGLSLGDRACLATAIAEKCPVMTADRAWAGLDLGIEIIVIR